MTDAIRCRALLILPLMLLAACGKDTPPPPPAPALERPLVTVTIRNNRILAPQIALIERGGVTGVFVMEDGVARFRMVRAGKTYDGRVEILSGLSDDEHLVTGDLRDVHDGSPVIAVKSSQ